ncbi:hypothetical protein STSO111631_23600 [Stackebrandtia soli]
MVANEQLGDLAARGEPEKIHVVEPQMVEERHEVGDEVFGLVRIDWKVAAAASAPAQIEGDHRSVGGDGA